MRKTRRIASIIASLWLVQVSVSALNADDWTQWRGNHRDGKSAEQGLLDSWPANGPQLLWQTNDLGGGFSTPSAADHTIYLLCSQDGESEVLIALSLNDGKQLWSQRIGAVGKNRGPQYPGTRSTPTLDASFVYTLGSDGDLVCANANSGTPVWTKNLPQEFAGKPGNWAYTESPLIDGDALVCSPGGADATVVALNKKDGSVIWKAALSEADEASYSSPVVAMIDGQKEYALFLAKGLAGLDAATGDLLWRYTHTADEAANVQTPIVRDNLIYTGASRVGGGLIRVARGKTEPTELYFSRTLPTGMGGSVLVDGYLYGTSGSTMICVDFETGEAKWQDRSIGAGSICYADGKVILHGEDNRVALIKATSEKYEELGQLTLPNAPDRGRSKAWAHPIIVEGKLIIRDVGTVWCYDIRG